MKKFILFAAVTLISTSSVAQTPTIRYFNKLDAITKNVDAILVPLVQKLDFAGDEYVPPERQELQMASTMVNIMQSSGSGDSYMYMKMFEDSRQKAAAKRQQFLYSSEGQKWAARKKKVYAELVKNNRTWASQLNRLSKQLGGISPVPRGLAFADSKVEEASDMLEIIANDLNYVVKEQNYDTTQKYKKNISLYSQTLNEAMQAMKRPIQREQSGKVYQ